MPRTEHFATVETWAAAEAMLNFHPLEPKQTEGCSLQSLQIHIRDHKHRDLSVGDRTLEAHYGAFVLSQARPGTVEARRLALVVSYGRAPLEVRVLGREGRMYELGPEPDPDDIDGREPAVVVWSDGEMFYLAASDTLMAEALLRVATSLH